MKFANTPIHQDREMGGWEDVPIIDCGEPLVSLIKLNGDRFCFRSEYFRNNLPGSIEVCYLRESAARLLNMAAKELPLGWKFIIYDGWRPLRVQESLFNKYYTLLEKDFPNKHASELLILTKRYVSLPSDNPQKPSPHNTGGAVDISIKDANGNDLDMGTCFDDFTECAKTRYFEQINQNAGISIEDHSKLVNRRHLYHLLSSVGFTNYYEEWWHYDYGNQFWAKLSACNAIYGAINPSL